MRLWIFLCLLPTTGCLFGYYHNRPASPNTEICDPLQPTWPKCGTDVPYLRSKETYAVFYGSLDYLSGVVATLQMLQESGTFRDVIVLSSVDHDAALVAICQLYGAIHKKVSMVENPIWSADAHDEAPNPLKTVAFTKIHLWGLEQYDKAIYLDADMLLLDNIDELFDIPGNFSAAPDGFPPHLFNSGLMVLTPNRETYLDLIEKSSQLPSYDDADQGFLNSYYSDWFESDNPYMRLHTRYNTKASTWCYNKYGLVGVFPIKVVHFTGCVMKPWQQNKLNLSELFWPEWRLVFKRATKFLSLDI